MDQALELAEEVVCPECGYDLRGIGSERCPECGQTIDRAELSLSRIPWEHRRKIGWIRAYWRTVRMATLSPGVLEREVARTVRYEDAWRFRLITMMLVAVPLLAGLAMRLEAVGTADALRKTFSVYEHHLFLWIVSAAEAWWKASLFIGAGLSAVWWTGVGGWFFESWRLGVRQRNRAVALSQYACGALALTPVVFVLWYVMGVLENARLWEDERISVMVVGGALMFELGAWWWSSVKLMKGATRCGVGRAVLVGIVLPVLWVGLSIVTVLLIFGVVAYAWMMIGCLRG